ncbi:RNA recognition motif domain-containing protein [Fluviispira sanaruensis]|uniref:RRM domain-containing protein n=1 Tax=Fluviispira sanaruensis TaxID=2493639 RepID=A0A4P2VJK6_FLUSA|nr:RNA-binding protein [Fluviispira sanaruensis]BBH53403.1 hypothetical protein JCM31447_18460 [Fluviispira sanaruensis]
MLDRHLFNSTGDPVGTKLYVGNLPFSVSENDVASLFEKAGNVASVRAVMDRETGRFKGFCFVEMGTEAEAQQAISMFNGSELNGRPMIVNEARPPEPRNNRGGFGGGHRGGDRGGNRTRY